MFLDFAEVNLSLKFLHLNIILRILTVQNFFFPMFSIGIIFLSLSITGHLEIYPRVYICTEMRLIGNMVKFLKRQSLTLEGPSSSRRTHIMLQEFSSSHSKSHHLVGILIILQEVSSPCRSSHHLAVSLIIL